MLQSDQMHPGVKKFSKHTFSGLKIFSCESQYICLKGFYFPSGFYIVDVFTNALFPF